MNNKLLLFISTIVFCLFALPAFAAPVIVPSLGLGIVGSAVASLAINVALSFVVSKLFGPPKPKFPTGGQFADPGVKQRVPSDPANKLPIIYGTKRTRGQITYSNISSDNQTMWFIITLAEGPISSGRSVRWDDQDVILRRISNDSDLAFGANLEPGVFYNCHRTEAGFGDSDPADDFLTDNLRIAFFPTGGDPSGGITGGSPEINNDSQWNVSGKTRAMPNVAYMYVELDYDRDAGVTGLTQDLSLQLDGRTVRNIVRVNDTEHSLSSTSTFSSNPARIAIDYLTNTRYGSALTAGDLDLRSFYEWQEFCDTEVSNASGVADSTRYTANGAINTGDDRDTIISDLFMAGGASFTYNLGRFGAIVERGGSSVYSFDDNNIFGEVTIANTGFDNILNKVTVKYDEINNFEQESQVIRLTPASAKNANEPVLERTLRSNFTNDRRIAERLAAILLNKSRLTQNISFSTDLAAVRLQAGDIVSFTYTLYGINTPKLYRILSIQEARISGTDANGQSYDMPGLRIAAQEYADAVYDNPEPLAYDPAPNTNYPNPRNITAVNTLVLDSEDTEANVPYFDLRWTVPNTGAAIEAFTIYQGTSATFNAATTAPIRTVRPPGASTFTRNTAVTYRMVGVEGSAFTTHFWVVPSNSYATGIESNTLSFVWNPSGQVGPAGPAGANGISVATIELFARNDSENLAPSQPDTDTVFTFATGSIDTDVLSDIWYPSVPPKVNDTDNFVWSIQRTVSSTNATVVIDSEDWTQAVLISAAGVQGQDGAPGTRGPGRWNIPVTTLPTTSAQAQAAWNARADTDTNFPQDGGVNSDQAWFYTGTESSPTGQSVWLRTGAVWTEQTEVIDGNLLVDGTITADKLNVNRLGAVSALMGEVLIDSDNAASNSIVIIDRKATNAEINDIPSITGARVTLDAIGLSVYDESGDLRVRVGYVGDL